jgi:hypothetical protein
MLGYIIKVVGPYTGEIKKQHIAHAMIWLCVVNGRDVKYMHIRVYEVLTATSDHCKHSSCDTFI